ncbi:uncharacterized protein PHACADRAFT_189886, partial [Phanerochaete carnosa HHB-10118-sp]
MTQTLTAGCMPKAGRKKYYAVRRGREGPKVYETWEECKLNVSRFPAPAYKSFGARAKAEAWIKVINASDPIVNSKPRQPTSGSKSHAKPQQPQSNAPAPVAPVQYPPIPQTGDIRETESDVPIEPTIKLSLEQQQVLNKVKAGESVFFTGSAGTGKSVLLREIIKSCRESGRQVAITASTGIAAVNIGGSTVHSWAGIGLGKELKEQLAMKILGQDKWKRIKDKERHWEQGLPSGNEYDSDDA